MKVTIVGAALIIAVVLLVFSIIHALTRNADPDQHIDGN
jgi:hypothetical protein